MMMMAVLLVAAFVCVGAGAADDVEDKPVTATKEVSLAYEVEVPAAVTFNAANTASQTVNVTVTNPSTVTSDKINLTITSDFTLVNGRDNNKTATYKITCGEYDSSSDATAVVYAFDASNATKTAQPATLTYAITESTLYVGTYTDELTFKFTFTGNDNTLTGDGGES